MKEITAAELQELLEKKANVTLVDVREPYEHEDYNIGGILIPLGEIPYSEERIRGLGDTEIVFYCRSGNRSLMAQKILAVQHSITNTINLKGGILAWRELSEKR